MTADIDLQLECGLSRLVCRDRWVIGLRLALVGWMTTLTACRLGMALQYASRPIALRPQWLVSADRSDFVLEEITTPFPKDDFNNVS